MAEQAAQAWTVLKLLNWTREHLAKAGLTEPRLVAEILLAHCLRCRRIDLYARFDHQPAPAELAAFRELIQRARRHEPPAYLVGQKEFYSLTFKVTPDVLIPRPETEILVDQALGHLRGLGRPARAWDVCTGSGCVAVAVAAHAPETTVLATDVSAAAVAVAGENVERHKLADRVRCRVADMLHLPDDCADLAPFDAITANPPYVADGDEVAASVEHEPKIALRGGPEGLDFLRPLIARAAEFLVPGGLLAMEFGCGQAGAVWELVQQAGLYTDERLLKDHQQIDRALVARRRP